MRSSRSWLDFAHRANGTGTASSICPRCYVTLATSTLESDLQRAETAHSCDPKQLRTFQSTHRPPFRSTWQQARQLNRIA